MISDLANLWRCSGPEWRLAFMFKHPQKEVREVFKALAVDNSVDGVLKAIHAPMKGC